MRLIHTHALFLTATTMIFISCNNFAPPLDPDKSKEIQKSSKSWCEEVAPLLEGEKNLECLSFPGAWEIGFFGPENSPKRHSLRACFPKDATGPKPEESSIEAGTHGFSYSRKANTNANAGLNLRALTGLSWVPDVAVNTAAADTIEVSATLAQASWASISSVATMLSARLQAAPSDGTQLSLCKDLQAALCTKDTKAAQPLSFPEQALLAVPTLTIKSSSTLSLKGDVGWNDIGVHADTTRSRNGTITLSWTKPLVIAVRRNPASAVVSAAPSLCAEPAPPPPSAATISCGTLNAGAFTSCYPDDKPSYVNSQSEVQGWPTNGTLSRQWSDPDCTAHGGAIASGSFDATCTSETAGSTATRRLVFNSKLSGTCGDKEAYNNPGHSRTGGAGGAKPEWQSIGIKIPPGADRRLHLHAIGTFGKCEFRLDENAWNSASLNEKVTRSWPLTPGSHFISVRCPKVEAGCLGGQPGKTGSATSTATITIAVE